MMKQKHTILKGTGYAVGAIKEVFFERYAYVFAIIFLAVSGILIYSNTFHSPFFFDDNIYIVENHKIRHLQNFWLPSASRYIGYLSFAINYYCGNLNVFGYHAVNTAIHITNAFLVYLLTNLTFKTPVMEKWPCKNKGILGTTIAIASSLIFIAHPVQTEAVTYITQRFTSLAALFYLAAIVLYIKARTNNSALPFFYILSISSAILAMKTKEISFTLPFVITLYEFIFFKNNKVRPIYLVPYFLTLVIIPLSIFFGPELDSGNGQDVAEYIRESQLRDLRVLSKTNYLLTQFRVIVTYMRLLILPVNQNLLYDYPVYDSALALPVILSFMFLLAFFLSAVYLLTRSLKAVNGYGLVISFGILWFFMTLSVESSIIPINDVIFEHRIYLPSVGMFMAFCSFVFCIADYMKIKRAAAVILLFVVGASFGAASYKRNNVWKDSVSLWEDVVSKSPASSKSYNNLGLAYYVEKKLPEEAIRAYRIAVKLKPDNAEAYNNIGQIYYDSGLIDKALEEYRMALKFKPDIAMTHNNIGLIYHRQGLLDDAVKEFMAALRQWPANADVHYNLGLVYARKGYLDEAINEYILALKEKPADADFHYSIGYAYRLKGMLKEASSHYKAAIEINPDFTGARKELEITEGTAR